MHITILNGSPRKNGNTQIMAETFAKGAAENGHQVELINLAGKKISGCIDCKYCFSHDGQCTQKDDMGDILAVLDQTDLLVFASPIYWFDITGQLKCVIDRMYARAKVGFHFHQTALLLDAGDENVFNAALAQYQATTTYLNWKNRGIITIGNMAEKGSMQHAPQLADVYELGKSI